MGRRRFPVGLAPWALPPRGHKFTRQVRLCVNAEARVARSRRHRGTARRKTFDPTKMLTGTDANRSHQVYNRLTNLDRNLNAVPNLAEEWEGVNDATEWTFKLRKGVEFHNGKTLTADDVIYSLNEHIKEGSKSPSKTLLASIMDMRADGDNVVKITLEQRVTPTFPSSSVTTTTRRIVAEGWRTATRWLARGHSKLVEILSSRFARSPFATRTTGSRTPPGRHFHQPGHLGRHCAHERTAHLAL